MPNLAAFHPQTVHFVVSLLILGVVFRFVSFTPWFKWTRHAATALLVLGTIGAAVAVKSGVDAHGPVERIPGVRDLVVHHEELGIRVRNIFYVVVAIDLIALAMTSGALAARVGKFAKLAYGASAILGAHGAFVLYEAAEHGGEIVYEFGGGPGLRTGNEEDKNRLLIAGLYHQGMADRAAKRPAEAARLFAELATRAVGDTTARLLHAESALLDSKDAAGALAILRATPVDPAIPRYANRKATLSADAFLALGMKDSARAVLAPIVAANPQNTRLKAKLDSIQ
jgi:uncharacterized membrane protein